MEKILTRELLWYAGTLAFLMFLMHPDLLSDPAQRLGLMQEKENYTHPLLYSFIVYLLLFLIRSAVKWIVGKFKKN